MGGTKAVKLVNVMTFDCQIYSNADPHILCILKPTRLVMDIYISGVQWCSEKYSK